VTVSCGQARRLLWPDAGPRPLTTDAEAAEQHVATCDECRLFLEEMRRLARLTHDLAPRPQAPREVRDRLFRAVARARTGTPGSSASGTRRWAAFALVAMLLVGVAVEWGRRADLRPDPIAGLVGDHMRATRGDGLVSGDSILVSRWLAERLPFAMEVPGLPSLTLRGARLCLRDGQRGGVVEYSADGRSVSYFVVPDWHSPASPPVAGELHRTKREGYHIVSWREPGLVHALVGDLAEARLVELARLCMSKMMAFLGAAAARMKESPLSGV
jgi:anti-sigma factor RsiW